MEKSWEFFGNTFGLRNDFKWDMAAGMVTLKEMRYVATNNTKKVSRQKGPDRYHRTVEVYFCIWVMFRLNAAKSKMMHSLTLSHMCWELNRM